MAVCPLDILGSHNSLRVCGTSMVIVWHGKQGAAGMVCVWGGHRKTARHGEVCVGVPTLPPVPPTSAAQQG